MPEILRDRWDRPLLPNPETGKNEPYTRASTLSGAIENTYGLEAWKRRQTVLGLSQRQDLIAKALSDPENKTAVDRIVDTAMEVAGSSKGANLGTAIHSFCETVDKGGSLPKGIDPRISLSIDAYKSAMLGWKMLAVEEFVGCRDVMSAGTFDRIVEAPDGRRYIGDIKTGASAPSYPHSMAVQLAVYAHGTRYSPETGWGRSLAEFGVSQTRAVLIWLPAEEPAKCELFGIDILEGWKMARIAARVRRWWKENPCEPIPAC